MRRGRLLVLWGFLFLSFPMLCKAEFSTQQLDLLKNPDRKAEVATTIPSGTAVEVLEKSGLWVQVSSGDVTGWVRKVFISENPPQDKIQGSALATAINLWTGREGSGNIVSSTGVRGLDAETLANSNFSDEEFQLLLSFAVSDDEARNFAKQAGLGGANEKR